jgi:hypothetical protein
MKKTGVYLVLFILTVSTVKAGLFSDKVDLADLSQLSSEALETLKDVEFRVFLSKVKHAEMKVLEKKAREDLKPVKLTLDAKRLQVKAAKAEVKDIQQKSAGKKLTDAEEALRNAQKDFDVASLHVEWKEKELDARIAAVEKEKAAIAVAEAERDLAQVSKLHEQKVASASKYVIMDFKKQVQKKRKEYESAVNRLQKEIAEARRLKEEFEKHPQK